MSFTIKKDQEHIKAIELITTYADQCPKCQSDNISNEDDTSIITCHDCSYQFTESDYMDKIHIVAYLRVKNLPNAANTVEDMEVAEFEDFLVNHIYS